MADAPGSTTSDLAALGSLAPLIINMLKGSNQPNPGALLGTLPGGQDLLNGVVGQQQQQAPLRQAVTQQAMNMLPGSAFPGGRPTLSAIGPGPAPVSSGSGTDIGKLLAAGGVGAGLGALLSKLAGSGASSGGPLSPLAKALAALFGHGGPGIQGNKPYAGGALPSGNTGMNGFTGWDDGGYGYDPNSNRGPTPTVDTSTTFGGVPGGVPDNPEDPSTVDPYWGGLNGGGDGVGSGYGDGANDVWGG